MIARVIPPAQAAKIASLASSMRLLVVLGKLFETTSVRPSYD